MREDEGVGRSGTRGEEIKEREKQSRREEKSRSKGTRNERPSSEITDARDLVKSLSVEFPNSKIVQRAENRRRKRDASIFGSEPRTLIIILLKAKPEHLRALIPKGKDADPRDGGMSVKGEDYSTTRLHPASSLLYCVPATAQNKVGS